MVLHTVLVLWPSVKWPIKVQATTHVVHSICSGLYVLSLLLAVHRQTSKWSVLTTWCFRAPLGYDPHKFCASFFLFFNSAEEIPPTSGALYRLRMVCQLPRLCSHPLPFVSGDSFSSERQSGHPAQPASPVGQRVPGCWRPSWQLLWNKTPLIPKCVQFSCSDLKHSACRLLRNKHLQFLLFLQSEKYEKSFFFHATLTILLKLSDNNAVSGMSTDHIFKCHSLSLCCKAINCTIMELHEQSQVVPIHAGSRARNTRAEDFWHLYSSQWIQTSLPILNSDPGSAESVLEVPTCLQFTRKATTILMWAPPMSAWRITNNHWFHADSAAHHHERLECLCLGKGGTAMLSQNLERTLLN